MKAAWQGRPTLFENVVEINLDSFDGLPLRLVNADGVADHQRDAEAKTFDLAIRVFDGEVARRHQAAVTSAYGLSYRARSQPCYLTGHNGAELDDWPISSGNGHIWATCCDGVIAPSLPLWLLFDLSNANALTTK